MPPLVKVPTATTIYPHPYDPGYNTIGELVSDSATIVLGTLGPTSIAPGQDGTPTTYYQIQIQQVLNDEPQPPISLYVSANIVNAAKLSLTGTYIFFWAGPDDPGRCIVGGVRGVMAYDPSTETVTRLDNNAASGIPRTQTLEQLRSSILAARNVIAGQRPVISNPPPACSISATGLSQ
jgi:hypothetical protein